MRKIYNQCLNVSENNYKYLKLSRDRAKGIIQEMEVAKAYSKIMKKDIKRNSKLMILDA